MMEVPRAVVIEWYLVLVSSLTCISDAKDPRFLVQAEESDAGEGHSTNGFMTDLQYQLIRKRAIK